MGSLVLCLVVTVCPLAVRAQGGDASPREVEEMLRRALNAGAYEEAIPLLSQMIEWFKATENRSRKLALERWRFSLGLCHYLTGQFPAAEKAFRNYLKHHRHGPHKIEAAVYLADGFRFTNQLDDAEKEYERALKAYDMNADWKTDVRCSLARCALAREDWKTAIPILEKTYRYAPDDKRANWAATLLCIGYLKEMQLERVYRLVPYLLRSDALSSRSVVFNLAALEAGDELFADELYREALWLHRLVYPRATIARRAARHVRRLKEDVADLREESGRHRELLRAREMLGEAEAELEALGKVEDYDIDLCSRIARAYMEVRRYREARALFRHLRDVLDVEAAETPLYLAFHCSTQVAPWTQAFELGLEYMEDYNGGEYYDAVSITIGQMYALEKNWPRVIEILTEAIEVSPEHESIAECLFLLGYAHFMEEHFPRAISWLRRLNTEFPAHDRIEESTYWYGMALLFNRNYADAFDVFDAYRPEFPASPYLEDATFRRAVSLYGLARFRDAEGALEQFNADFPGSPLAGEAWMMLADVSGNFGELGTAVGRFGKALDRDLNIELYIYCTFRRTEMLHDLERHADLRTHLTAYIDVGRQGCNIPMAAYWIARSLWEEDRRDEAMSALLSTVADYGNDRTAAAVDMLLEEWVSRTRNLSPEDAKAAWAGFWDRMMTAGREKQTPLFLRLQRVFLHKPGLEARARDLLLGSLLSEESLPEAPPSVLEFMVDSEATHPDLARAAAETIVRDFPETDFVIGARMLLARRAIDEERFKKAAAHLDTIRVNFATTPDAARAILLLGRMYMKQRRYDQADEAFKQVLGVREWRGPLWPEALYERGECARQQRKYDKACAFYERIYVLYVNHTDWAARAYVRRAECLIRLHRHGLATEVLQEMRANGELEETPEWTEAAALLAKLEARP